jgi:hypothetical protein
MKKLLWISRHEPNEAQLSHIVNKIGEVEFVGLNKSTKEEIKKYIYMINPDCIVAIIPRTWFSYLLKDIPKTTIFLKPKCKTVHPGDNRDEPCKDFNVDTDILIDPSVKRWEDYITRGDSIIHLRHSGYERIILSDRTLLFINWKEQRNI